MLDWDTFAGSDPLPQTLPQETIFTQQGEVDWLPQTVAKGGFDEFEPLFGSEGGGEAGDDDGATDVGDVIVIGERPEEPWWDIDNLPGGGGDSGPTGGEGPGSGDGPDPVDEDCPWTKFYEDVARQIGVLAGALGAIKDSWITFDPRDDRAIERALIAIDGLEIMLQSQTISYATAHDSISSVLEIMLSEGTDHLAAVFGAAAGGLVTGLFDGPIPVGEVIGGIGGAIAVYVAGDRLPTATIADVIASLVLAGIDIPPGTPGAPCGSD